MNAKAIVKKPLRADAERNRQRVLEVAQAVFANEGLAVPIDEIAKRAGLGIGTLYRHFPTKEALFEAIVIGRMEALVAEAKAALDERDACEALFGVLRNMMAGNAAKKDFIDALASTGFDVMRAIGEIKKELHATLELLLKRAQRAKKIRKDIDIKELMALLMGALGGLERMGIDAKARERLMCVLLDGLRAPA